MRIFSNCLKGLSLFAIVAMLTVSASAQIKLRKAMDFDGDGKADLSVFRPSNNFWYVYKSTGSYLFQQFGAANTDYQTPGDYDGDGKADVAVWRDTTGVWYRFNSSNNTFVAYQFGVSGDEPVARDYDGDGKFDIAVQRPGANATDQAVFFVVNSSNSSVSTVPWGASTDLVAPGDYDGDGKTDYAVVREGTTPDAPLTWYILGSNGWTFTAVSFGATGTDYTVQNDYDGDGKTDIAVWRDTNGTFYIRKSSDGSMTGIPWGIANDFPIGAYDTH